MRAFALLAILAASTAQAQENRFTALAGLGVWNADERPFHGALVLAYDFWQGVGDGHLGLELNTETLRASYDAVKLSERVEVGVGLTGELFAAGVSRDYWQEGRHAGEKSYLSSYILAHGALKAQIDERTFFEVIVAGRRWFFGEDADTAPAFALPADAWVFEPRLRYTWWNLQHDAGWSDRHRVFPRLRGVAVGFELGVDARSEAREWGARDPVAFGTPDPRNEPGVVLLRPRQWLLAGWQLHERVRTQLQESAAFGVGEDDLTRDRIGGLTPYTVPLAGAPWAAFLSERYLAGQWSWHFRAVDDLEIGPLATALVLEDPERTGEQEAGAHWGVGALADWRFGPWQLDLRGGWSPTVADASDRAAWSVWLSGGWTH